MKNWKRLLSVGLLSAILGTGMILGQTSGINAQGMPYDRRDNLSPDEILPSVGATEAAKSVSKKAWKKINGVCYNGSGQKLEGAITRGIDVSEWQDTIDWSKVKKSNVDFAFVRISYGLNHIDMKYDYNMKQAEKVGMPVGTYIYSLATTTQQAMKEAQLAIKNEWL